jgi:hypothetical protein
MGHYILLKIDNFLGQLQGASVFSEIYLRSNYHQVRVKEEDIPNTVFWTHYGYYEFLVMSFGLTNAPNVFMDTMNIVFHNHLDQFIVFFIDDILVYSKNQEDHGLHLWKKLERFRREQL